MANYGNIVAIFTDDANTKTEVENIFTNNQVRFANCKNLYFVETTSKTNTSTVISQIKGLGIQFLFYHNYISDGSQIRSNGIDSDLIKSINNILF